MELKPCPFCGQPIAKKPYTRLDVGTRIRQGVIVCSCGVEMRIHVFSEQTINRWRVGGYQPKDVYAVYKGDVNDTDAVIRFTKDEIVKRWNSRSDNAYLLASSHHLHQAPAAADLQDLHPPLR